MRFSFHHHTHLVVPTVCPSSQAEGWAHAPPCGSEPCMAAGTRESPGGPPQPPIHVLPADAVTTEGGQRSAQPAVAAQESTKKHQQQQHTTNMNKVGGAEVWLWHTTSMCMRWGVACTACVLWPVVCLWPSLQGRTHRVRVQDGSGAWCRARRPWKSTCPTAESHGTKFLDHTSEGKVPIQSYNQRKGHEGGALRVRGMCVVLCVLCVVSCVSGTSQA